MAGVFLEDNDIVYSLYKVKVKKGWFRGKDVFINSLHWYESRLLDMPQIDMRLDAGSMIYELMQKLIVGVEWEKQSALMMAYRSLVYRLSYTTVTWYEKDRGYLEFSGMESDIYWAISFISQVYPDEKMHCVTVVPQDSNEEPVEFTVCNGNRVDIERQKGKKKKGDMPDIWSIDAEELDELESGYDENFIPESQDPFYIPDGRRAFYIRMDDRFRIANMKGRECETLDRHNISASMIKDFEDMIHKQTEVDYDVYQLRYSAFMNKVHEVEDKIGGFEASVYDILPIAERGIPLAPHGTVERTNWFDKNSLKYAYEKIVHNRKNINVKKSGSDIVKSVRLRLVGYDTEYQTYIATGTDKEIISDIYRRNMNSLYADFAKIDATGLFRFPETIYRDLCNVPKDKVRTEWEKEKINTFGRGYIDFVMNSGKKAKQSEQAFWKKVANRLSKNYLNKKK